eukprot:XP_001702452.1 CPD photolyase type II [Chlamydomonas reinhardtii]
MKLYIRAELEAVAHRKWGGAEGLAAEQRRREARRETRAAAAAASSPGAAGDSASGGGNGITAGDVAAAAAGANIGVGGADRGGWSSFGWLQLPPLITERIRQVLPLPPLGSGNAGGVSGGGGSASLATAPGAGAAASRPAAGTPAQRGGSVKRPRLEEGAAEAAGRAGPRSVQLNARVEADADVEVEVVDLVMEEGGEDEGAREVATSADGTPQGQQELTVGNEGRGVAEKGLGRTIAGGGAEADARAGAAAGAAVDDDVIVISSSSSEGSGASSSHSESDDEQDSGGRLGSHAPDAAPAGAAAAQAQLLVTQEGAAATASVAAMHGEYVMYWMKTAVRGHENPALDAALAAAAALRLPLLVAAFVLPGANCQAHGNLRRIKFQLEGLRDAQRELQQRLGLRLHVHAEGLTAAAALSGSAGAQSATNGAGDISAPRGVPSSSTAAGSGVSSSPWGAGWEDLVATASRAALVVTEDMPVDPDAGWLAALVRRLQRGGAGADAAAATAVDAAVPAPGVWAVDTSCVVPMRLVPRAYEKAYAYRSATEAGAGPMHRFLHRASGANAAASAQPASASDGAGSSVGGGGAAGSAAASPAGPAAASIAPEWPSLDLLALPVGADGTCDLGVVAASIPGVDKSVPGVSHMIGGSGAGYARWDAWRRGGGVGRYAASRNDAMQRGGTSRMSAYLHWGMVSPFRVTREAAASGGSGCAKFLDELLVWRELAYSFCFHRCGQLDSLAVLPRWAQDTLAAHASDPRAVRSLQQLETGTTGRVTLFVNYLLTTAFAPIWKMSSFGFISNRPGLPAGDTFWDAAQRQLSTHGELHNNVRMTWGKAPLAWFALDGCDPASYGGVLWCFGLFDGPKDPASTPITGTLRRRPTSSHARRLDPAAYEALRP